MARFVRAALRVWTPSLAASQGPERQRIHALLSRCRKTRSRTSVFFADPSGTVRSTSMADEQTHEVPPKSHATELLANERTFLAWVRTSIAVISLGFAVTKLDESLRQMAQTASGGRLHGIGWSLPMGLGMIVLGGLLSVLAAWRYHVVNRQIECGEVRADRDLVVMVVA